METLEEKVERHDREIQEMKKEMRENSMKLERVQGDVIIIKKDVKSTKTDNKKYGKLTIFLLCLVIALFGVLFATNAEQAKTLAQYTATNYKVSTIVV